MKTHRIETKPSAYEFEKGCYKAPDYILRVKGAENGLAGYGIGGWDSSTERRVVTQGPLIRGPQAYAFGLASVLDNHGGSKRTWDEARAAGRLIEAEPGDHIVMQFSTFRLSLDNRGYPHLEWINNPVTKTDDGLCEDCEKPLTDENLVETDLGFYCSETCAGTSDDGGPSDEACRASERRQMGLT